LCSIAFVVVSAFLVFDLDDKFYPKPQEHAASMDYTEAPNRTLTPVVESATLESTPVISEKQPVQAPKPRVQNEPKSRLFELEQKQFQLNLSGDAYVSGMVKKASLTIKMAPIKGTNLQKFQTVESRMILDNSGVSITGTGVQIIGQKITMDFTANNVGAFSMSGILDNPILEDANNKQNVVLEDQNFYLIKKETPYRLNMIGTLTS
jgi:hypothetical protein